MHTLLQTILLFTIHILPYSTPIFFTTTLHHNTIPLLLHHTTIPPLLHHPTTHPLLYTTAPHLLLITPTHLRTPIVNSPKPSTLHSSCTAKQASVQAEPEAEWDKELEVEVQMTAWGNFDSVFEDYDCGPPFKIRKEVVDQCY